MAAHARLKNESMEDEKCHFRMTCLICPKDADKQANSIALIRKAPEQPDLGLHCLPVCFSENLIFNLETNEKSCTSRCP